MARIIMYLYTFVVVAFHIRGAVGQTATGTVSPSTSITPSVTTGSIQPNSSVTPSLSLTSTASSINASNATSSIKSSTSQNVVQSSVQPSPSQTVPSTTSAPTPTNPSTSGPTKGTAIWDKAIDLATPMGSFIIVVVAVGLVLILLIALIVVCCKYCKLKKKTKFPGHMTINESSDWIRSNDDLLMWERNLRATEVSANGHHGAVPNRPFNEKRK